MDNGPNQLDTLQGVDSLSSVLGYMQRLDETNGKEMMNQKSGD